MAEVENFARGAELVGSGKFSPAACKWKEFTGGVNVFTGGKISPERRGSGQNLCDTSHTAYQYVLQSSVSMYHKQVFDKLCCVCPIPGEHCLILTAEHCTAELVDSREQPATACIMADDLFGLEGLDEAPVEKKPKVEPAKPNPPPVFAAPPVFAPPPSASSSSSLLSSSSVKRVSAMAPPGSGKSDPRDNLEYDPERPHDYDEILRERASRSKQADHLKLAQDWKAKQEKSMEDFKASESTLNASGDEAYQRRLRLSKQAGSSMAAEMEKREDEDRRYEKMASGNTKEGAVQKMMAKMGWKGGALGAKEDGILNPLEHVSTGKSTAVVQEMSETGRKKKLKGNPSCVVLLRNVVGPGEVDDDLQGEIGGEASKFGEVQSVTVYEIPLE
eukprot:gene3916-304_t